MGGFQPPELLDRAHVVDAFDCGSPAQTEWLRRYGLAAQASGSSRVFVTTQFGSSDVAGYYALAAGSVEFDNAGERLRKGVGRHPIPVVVLTRLGVDLPHQGKGVGRLLVRDALLRVDRAADEIGVRAVLIHAESETARSFYLGLAEFEIAPTDPLHLVLLLKDLRALLH